MGEMDRARQAAEQHALKANSEALQRRQVEALERIADQLEALNRSADYVTRNMPVAT